MKTLSLIGAYGRQYTTKGKALVDWYTGKDFKIVCGPYCSIRDIDYMKRLNDKIEIVLSTGEKVEL